MPIEPLPAPTSHSCSPGPGSSAASVTARTACLVSWPSCSYASSGSPGMRDRLAAPGSAWQSTATQWSSTDRTLPPLRGSALRDALAFAAELLEHDHAAATEAALAQHARHAARPIRAGDVGHDAPAGLQRAREHLRRTSDGADELDVGGGPAQARAGDREGRDVGIDPHAPRPEPPHQRGADPVQHGVAAREHAGRSGNAVAQLVDEGVDRRRPGTMRRGGRRQERKLPLRAHDHLGGQHGGARILSETRPAVGADADDDERRARSRHPRPLGPAAPRSRAAPCGESRPVHVQEARLERAETKPSSRSLPRAASRHAGASSPSRASTCA